MGSERHSEWGGQRHFDCFEIEILFNRTFRCLFEIQIDRDRISISGSLKSSCSSCIRGLE